jgi:hypothetical protein
LGSLQWSGDIGIPENVLLGVITDTPPVKAC